MTNKPQKIKLHIPVAQYGFFEYECEEKDALEMYNKYAEKPIGVAKPNVSDWKVIKTFTGEKVKYSDEQHKYTDMKGVPLMSGSAYAKQFEKPFPLEMLSEKVSDKHKVPQDDIKAMWSQNGLISRTLGTALHLTMEQWFLHREHGTEKDYHLPKHPFLRTAVETFPDRDKDVRPEIMVSTVDKLMVGQIDGLVVTGEKKGYIIDYKTDVDVKKNLKKHQLQLSFYAQILMDFGWTIDKLVIWNYVEDWTSHELDILNPLPVK